VPVGNDDLRKLGIASGRPEFSRSPNGRRGIVQRPAMAIFRRRWRQRTSSHASGPLSSSTRERDDLVNVPRPPSLRKSGQGD